jgi:hypothetical protein
MQDEEYGIVVSVHVRCCIDNEYDYDSKEYRRYCMHFALMPASEVDETSKQIPRIRGQCTYLRGNRKDDL